MDAPVVKCGLVKRRHMPDCVDKGKKQAAASRVGEHVKELPHPLRLEQAVQQPVWHPDEKECGGEVDQQDMLDHVGEEQKLLAQLIQR